MEENKLAIQNRVINEDIKNLIYTIRNKQVMIDSDVAMLSALLKSDIAVSISVNIGLKSCCRFT